MTKSHFNVGTILCDGPDDEACLEFAKSYMWKHDLAGKAKIFRKDGRISVVAIKPLTLGEKNEGA